MSRTKADHCEYKVPTMIQTVLTLVLLNRICPAFTNSEDPDRMASEEPDCSGSAMFAIKYVNLYQQP